MACVTASDVRGCDTFTRSAGPGIQRLLPHCFGVLLCKNSRSTQTHNQLTARREEKAKSSYGYSRVSNLSIPTTTAP